MTLIIEKRRISSTEPLQINLLGFTVMVKVLLNPLVQWNPLNGENGNPYNTSTESLEA